MPTIGHKQLPSREKTIDLKPREKGKSRIPGGEEEKK